MGLVETIISMVQPKRDAKTLYVSIDELPRPRDWGTVDFSIGNQSIISRDMSLDGSAVEELVNWIEENLKKIKGSGYERVVYANVSEALQGRIDRVLGR
jgi:hypothetical protein